MAMQKRWSDERGAILVLGIMLGAFLVGALFYLVGETYTGGDGGPA